MEGTLANIYFLQDRRSTAIMVVNEWATSLSEPWKNVAENMLAIFTYSLLIEGNGWCYVLSKCLKISPWILCYVVVWFPLWCRPKSSPWLSLVLHKPRINSSSLVSGRLVSCNWKIKVKCKNFSKFWGM